MKRTRRVEVIRYSRRSTVISNELALEADPTEEPAAFDVLLEIPGTTESPVDDASGAEQQVANIGQRRRPLRFLKRLIRG